MEGVYLVGAKLSEAKLSKLQKETAIFSDNSKIPKKARKVSKKSDDDGNGMVTINMDGFYYQGPRQPKGKSTI